MTTTVLRGKTGALRRIVTGALRRKGAPVATDSIVAFCNESISVYYNPGAAPDSIVNVRGRANWDADVAAFVGVQADLLNARLAFASQIVHVTESSDESAPIKPPDRDYPTDLFVASMVRFPTFSMFSAITTTNGNYRPIMLLIDDSGSMHEDEPWMEPGWSEYMVNPPSGFVPEVLLFPLDADERWLSWIVADLRSRVS